MYIDSRLLQFTEGVRLRIAAAAAVGGLAAAVGVAKLALMGWLLAKVFRGDSLASLWIPFALVGAVIVFRGLLEYWRNMIAHHTAARVQVRLRERLYDKICALGPAHFGHQSTGGVILSVIDGVEQLEAYFGQFLPQVLVAVVTPLAVFVFVAYLDVPVATVLLAAAIFSLIAPQIFRRWDTAKSKARNRAYKAFAAEFLDTVQGLATLKAFGQSGERGRRLAAKSHALFQGTMGVLAIAGMTRGISDTGVAVGAAAALGLGAYRVSAGAMSLEALLVVLMMGVEVFRPVRELRAILHQGVLAQSAAQALFQLLDAEPTIGDGGTAPGDARRLAATVAFEDVGFAYPGGRRAVLGGLSFEIGAGERVAMVGASGAGKSSIVRLLLRFFDPQAGCIRVGGQDLRDLPVAEVRRRFAVVNQDTYLFHGTIEDNLRLGKLEATAEELEAAARAANIYDFIAGLPQGYGTVVGERGIRLSGGERQRVAIARALLRDAPILVLDEALSSVDSENEAVIQEALDRLMEGRTTLVVAHRLSSIIGADRILVLEDGGIAESGTHAQLMARQGPYHRLMAAQASGTRQPLLLANGDGDGAAPADALSGDGSAPSTEAADSILRAEGLSWGGAIVRLMAYAAPWKGRLAATFGLGITRVFALIGVSALSALVVAALKEGNPYGDLLVGLAVVAPVAGVVHWLESWAAHDMAYRMLSDMRIALYRQLDRLAPAYLLRRRSGDLVSLATQDVETVEFFFAHTVAPTLVAVLVPAAVLTVLGLFGWPLALTLLPFLAAVGLGPLLLRRRIDAHGSKSRESLGELNAQAVDTIQGLGEIAAYQQEAALGRTFISRVRAYHRVRLPFFSDLTANVAALEVLSSLGGLAVIVCGSRLVASGDLAAPVLPLMTLLAMSAFLPVSEIANIGRELADTLGSTRRLHALHGEEPAVADAPGSFREEPAAEPGAEVEMADVRFTYPEADRLALDGIDLKVPSGHTAALVGPSGAGKTTTAHLLMRFFDPASGTVRLNGRDLGEFPLDALRDRMALVAQDTYLFNDTLRANVLIARPGANEGDLAEAVERAALDEFVASLPGGLDTPVGERGMQLSGGQRQRVAIARAFLKDAPVLILDEATSHLDAINEGLVQRALADLMHDRTTVVIAHRLSTVRDADIIFVLEGGRVVETGTHAALLEGNRLYARLVARQSGAIKAAAD